LTVKDEKTLLEFLKRNNLEFIYHKYDNGLYDIHITNVTLTDLSFADFDKYVIMNFIINNTDFKFLHIQKTSLGIEINIGDLHSHDEIILKKARIIWDRIEGLEILWKDEK